MGGLVGLRFARFREANGRHASAPRNVLFQKHQGNVVRVRRGRILRMRVDIIDGVVGAVVRVLGGWDINVAPAEFGDHLTRTADYRTVEAMRRS